MTTLADHGAREAIRTQLDVTMMVEAAAGTGKTSSLVSRAVALLRSGRASVATLAAITFTVKAAAQLRERIQEELERQAGEGSGDERDRLDAAVRDLDRAVIGTTHAFCARLLRERPVEAGLDPEFDELDDVAARIAIADFWQRWYDARAAVGDERLVTAREVGLKAELLRATFMRLVDHHGDVEIVATPCAKPDLRHAVQTVRELVAQIAGDLPDASTREKADDFELMMRDLIRDERSLDFTDVDDQLKYLERANHASRKPTQKNWPDRQRARGYGETYRSLVTQTVRPTLLHWREYVHCIALEVLRPALDDFAKERLANATLTFGDLLVRSRDLLRDHANVRRYFQSRFTHVLVDEFQDTDPVQAEVLFFLTGTDANERNWRKLAPRAGSLFIVGDPKQSIYRFRRADISTYLEVKQRIVATGGRVVALSTNFRSVAPICGFVNQAFARLFDDASVAAGRQAPHHPLAPFHEGGGEGAIRDGVYSLETASGTNNEIADAEAPCVAEWIRHAVAGGQHLAGHGGPRPLRYGDVMLVSRDRRHLSLYARELESRGIPYRITGGDGLSSSEALLQLLPLLRAVCDPDDAISLVAFLRGRYCGASDQDLFDHVQLGGRWSPYALISDDAPAAIRDGMGIVRASIDATRQLPPAAALARIFELVALTPAAAAQEQAGTSAGNTLLALAIARQESAAGGSFAGVVERIAEILEADLRIEEMDVDPSRADAVQLMNLHQVKGLEAPVVFLIDPIRVTSHEPAQHIDRTGETSRGHFVIRTERRGRTAPRDIAVPHDWAQLEQREEEFNRAEGHRLLYVAATRAMNVLVIGVTRKDGAPQGVWAELAREVTQALLVTNAPRAGQAAAGSPWQSPAQGLAKIESGRAASAAASYSVLPITKIAHDHAKLVKEEEGLGRGTSWGRVMHRLLEALVRDPSIDVSLYASNLLKDEERDAAELGDVLETIAAVRGSGLWQRILDADQRLVEVPFAVSVNAREAGVDFDGETLLHGTIDLAFREGGRWWIIDYKSDRTSGRMQMLVDYYAPQVAHYVRFWQQLTGQETRGGLFFVDGAQLVEL